MFYISTLHRFEMFDIPVGEINKTTMYEQDGSRIMLSPTERVLQQR